MKNSKKERSLRDLKTIFEQEIWLKWDQCFQRIKILDIYSVSTAYEWVKSLKDKKGKAVLNASIEIVNAANCKLDKLWVDQERQFYHKRERMVRQ